MKLRLREDFLAAKKTPGGLFKNLFGNFGKAKNLAKAAEGLGVAAEGGAAVVAAGSATLPFLLWFLAILFICGFFLIIIVYGGCNYPKITSKIDRRLSYMGLAGQGKICDYIDSTGLGKALNNGLDNNPGSESGISPEGLLSTGKWTEALNTSASKYPPTDACILRVVVQKESRGNENVVGCDCAYNGQPQACLEPTSSRYYPQYRFNWAQCSYGIGLTQWTIYQSKYASVPQSDVFNYYKRWMNPSTPSRKPFNDDRFYTVADFADPQMSLDLTAKSFARNLTAKNGDVRKAFEVYVGASSSQQKFVEERMALYNMCKSSTGQ